MKAGAAGEVEAVVKAINAYINNAGVCEQGCKTLVSTTTIDCKNTINSNKINKMNSFKSNEGRSSRRG